MKIIPKKPVEPKAPNLDDYLPITEDNIGDYPQAMIRYYQQMDYYRWSVYIYYSDWAFRGIILLYLAVAVFLVLAPILLG